MNSSNLNKTFCSCLVLLFLPGLILPSSLKAKDSAWQRKQVDWRAPGGSRIKAINYPPDKAPPLLAERKHRKKTKKPSPAAESVTTELSPSSVFANVIDSPPIGGFVPWIVVSATNARDFELELNAVPTTEIDGSYLTDNPQADYALGIFDTGASANLLSFEAAAVTGLFDFSDPDNDLVTSSLVTLIGATGSVDALVSHPLGMFIDGIGAVEPNNFLADTSLMVGETNVSIIVGDPIESPNLPTAVGSPLAVYFAAHFRNDLWTSITYDGNDFNGPDVQLYALGDANIPTYPNKINLQLRPSDGVAVQYWPCIEPIMICPDGDGAPISPSLITGFLPTQSLYFLPEVDLADGNDTAPNNDKFMFDTGAQVTVISEIVAASLHLNPASPDFTVDIQDVTGAITIEPGFFLDLLEIPALGQWMSFTNAPVVMLNINSPEGGLLDGIIGMNLFVEYNFLLHGGGLMGQGYNPYIEFGPIPYHIPADIVPRGGDGVVDSLDLAAFAKSWLATPVSPNWNKKCDFAPLDAPDEHVDFFDYAVFAGYWLEEITP